MFAKHLYFTLLHLKIVTMEQRITNETDKS